MSCYLRPSERVDVFLAALFCDEAVFLAGAAWLALSWLGRTSQRASSWFVRFSSQRSSWPERIFCGAWEAQLLLLRPLPPPPLPPRVPRRIPRPVRSPLLRPRRSRPGHPGPGRRGRWCVRGWRRQVNPCRGWRWWTAPDGSVEALGPQLFLKFRDLRYVTEAADPLGHELPRAQGQFLARKKRSRRQSESPLLGTAQHIATDHGGGQQFLGLVIHDFATFDRSVRPTDALRAGRVAFPLPPRIPSRSISLFMTPTGRSQAVRASAFRAQSGRVTAPGQRVLSARDVLLPYTQCD